MYVIISSVGFSGANMISPLVFAFVILVFSREDGSIANILKVKVFCRLGTLSYSIYLNHFFFVLLARYSATFVERALDHGVRIEVMSPTIGAVSAILIGNQWIMDLLTLLFIGLIVGFSFFTYKYIEIPWQSRINKLAMEPIRLEYRAKPR
jgi:peptidoglycan/LPS O-acetylase OafA/YrhL